MYIAYFIDMTLKNEKGISLLESVIGVIIMAVGLFTGSYLVSTTSQTNISNEYQKIAVNLANEKIERILSDSYLRSTQFSYITSSNYPSETLPYGSTGNFFQRSVAIQEVADDLQTPTPGSDYKLVDVTVTWNDGSGSDSITVSALVTDYDYN